MLTRYFTVRFARLRSAALVAESRDTGMAARHVLQLGSARCDEICRFRCLRYKLIVVSFFQQLLDVFRRLGLFQESAERVVPQLP